MGSIPTAVIFVFVLTLAFTRYPYTRSMLYLLPFGSGVGPRPLLWAPPGDPARRVNIHAHALEALQGALALSKRDFCVRSAVKHRLRKP